MERIFNRTFNRRDLIRGAVELAKGGTLFWLFGSCVPSNPELNKFIPSPKLRFVEVPLLSTENKLVDNIQEGIDVNRLNNFKAKLLPLVREKANLFEKDPQKTHLWIAQGEKDSSAILAHGTSAWFIRGEREPRLEKVSGRVINTEGLMLNPPRPMRTEGLTVNSGFEQYSYGTVYDEFVDRFGWTIYRKKPHEYHESSLSRMEIVRTGEEVPVINLGSHYVEVKMPTPLPGLSVDMAADWINFSFVFYHTTQEHIVDEAYGKWDALYGKWLNGPKKNMPLFRLPNILSQQTAKFIKVSLGEHKNNSGMPAEIIEKGGWIKKFDFALNHSGLFFALPPGKEAIFPALHLLDGTVTETKQASDNANYVEIRSSMDSRIPIRFFFPRTGEFLIQKGQAIQLGTPLFRITNIPGHPYQLGFEKDFRAMEGEVAFMMSVTPFGYAAGEWRTIGNIGFGWPETEKGEYILIPTRSRSR